MHVPCERWRARSSCSVGRCSGELQVVDANAFPFSLRLCINVVFFLQDKFIPTLRNVKMALLYPADLTGSVSSEPVGVVDASKHLVEWSLGDLRGGSKNVHDLKFELDSSLHKPLLFTLKARFDPSVLASVPDGSGPNWSIKGIQSL